MKQVKDNIVVENADIGFRNFSGKPGRFNKEGERSFAWFIGDPALAEVLQDVGWNVRYLAEADEQIPYMNVAVRFGSIPPKIVIVDEANHRMIPLDEESISMLDYSEIRNIDMVIRPYNWEAQGRTGVKAYLKTMYVTLVQEDFGGKYSDYREV